MQIRYKKYSDKAKTPTYAHEHDGCFDIYVTDKKYDPANNIIEYLTDVGFEIPEGYVGLVFPRSSIFKTPHLLRNCVGVIDHNFTAAITCKFLSVTKSPEQYEIGDRCAQMMIIPRPKVEFIEVESFDKESRGGYGSTNEVKEESK